MRKFASAMILSACVALQVFAQTKVYHVKNGDTISAISSRFGVSQSELIRLNGLSNAHRLKLGQALKIPSTSKTSSRKATNVKATSGGYVVRNGDNDWSIAAKFGISATKLRQMNPGVAWTKLQIGQRLNVPGKTISKTTVVKSTAPRTGKAIAYTVRSGDNDWIIAKRFGVAPSALRSANPNVKWTNLKVGATIRIPGVSAPTAQVASHTIKSRYAVIAKDNVVVRRGPSTSSGKVTIVSAGTPVKVVSRSGDWYKLQFPKGTIAWVRGDMLKATSRPPSVVAAVKKPSAKLASNRKPRSGRTTPMVGGNSHSVVDYAIGMIGTRYRYGSSSRSGTDCSGMVLQAYRAIGVKLPRTSHEMSRVGQPVAKGDLRPGDLVFFRTRGSSRISHVGIYKGNGQFVHASSGQGHVTISNLSEGYYSRKYAGARRVLKGSPIAKRTPAPTPKPEEQPVIAEPVTTLTEPKTEPKRNQGTTEIVP